MEFILILIFANPPNAMTSQAVLFPNQAACENARQLTQEGLGKTSPFSKVEGICVPYFSNGPKNAR